MTLTVSVVPATYRYPVSKAEDPTPGSRVFQRVGVELPHPAPAGKPTPSHLSRSPAEETTSAAVMLTVIDEVLFTSKPTSPLLSRMVLTEMLSWSLPCSLFVAARRFET